MRTVSCILFFLFSLTFLSKEAQADLRINVQNNFGYTAVDVSEAMDIPEERLDDWDNFNYKGLIQIFFKKSGHVSWGPELGFNRLYYWEERYKPVGFSPRWRWDTIWTWHVGGCVRRSIASQYYVLTGASLHTFFNGSGTSIGIPLAVGHDIRISDVITIPIEFRMDVVFGDAVPIGLGGGVGITYTFGE